LFLTFDLLHATRQRDVMCSSSPCHLPFAICHALSIQYKIQGMLLFVSSVWIILRILRILRMQCTP
jgi:hypothetical protein